MVNIIISSLEAGESPGKAPPVIKFRLEINGDRPGGLSPKGGEIKRK